MKVDLKNITYKIGSRLIIENICLRAEPKKFTGIIGPNGSGKSTILKCLYRSLKPTSGSIFFDDKNLSDLTIKESALKTAAVAQHNFSGFDFDVLDIVIMGRSPYKRIMEADNDEDWSISLQALAAVGLENFSGRKFFTLSGGEQQRVILARALAQKTPCLILDEPTNSLDIKYQLQIMDIIKKLDVTVIAAIHDLNIAAMYCDKIFAVNNGRIIAQGTPRQIFTAEFIQDIFEVEASVDTNEKTGLINIAYRGIIPNQPFPC